MECNNSDKKEISQNNEIANKMFQNLLAQYNVNSIYLINIDDYLTRLKFAFENKVELYFVKNENPLLIGKLLFTRESGGRVGIVHGGYLFLILYLAAFVFYHKVLNKNLIFHKLTTHYLMKVEVDSILIIKAMFAENNNEIIAELIDCNNKVVTRINCVTGESSIKF